MSFQFANRLFQYFKMDPLVLKNKQVLFSFSLKRFVEYFFCWENNC